MTKHSRDIKVEKPCERDEPPVLNAPIEVGCPASFVIVFTEVANLGNPRDVKDAADLTS